MTLQPPGRGQHVTDKQNKQRGLGLQENGEQGTTGSLLVPSPTGFPSCQKLDLLTKGVSSPVTPSLREITDCCKPAGAAQSMLSGQVTDQCREDSPLSRASGNSEGKILQ